MRKIDHVIVLHGIGANPFIMWFPWLRLKLELRGIHVEVPILPRSFNPDLTAWKKAARAVLKDVGPSTMVIGHSLGGAFTVRLLAEGLLKNVGCVALVSAPIARTLPFEPVIPFFERPLDWSLIRKQAKKFLVLHAKNDPVVPFDHSIRYSEQLGVRPTLTEKGGHFAGPTNAALWNLILPLLRR